MAKLSEDDKKILLKYVYDHGKIQLEVASRDTSIPVDVIAKNAGAIGLKVSGGSIMTPQKSATMKDKLKQLPFTKHQLGVKQPPGGNNPNSTFTLTHPDQAIVITPWEEYIGGPDAERGKLAFQKVAIYKDRIVFRGFLFAQDVFHFKDINSIGIKKVDTYTRKYMKSKGIISAIIGARERTVSFDTDVETILLVHTMDGTREITMKKFNSDQCKKIIGLLKQRMSVFRSY